VRREDIWTLVVRQAKDNKRPASWPSNGVDCFNHLAQLCHEQLGIEALFVSAYKRLIGGNKRESRQTFCLFSPILAYVVSHFRDLNYEKRKARSEKIFA